MTVVSRLRKDAALRSVARAEAAGPARPGPDLRPGRDRPGQAGRPAAGLVLRHVRAVRGEGGQEVQDVPGDLAAGRRRDPGGAGGRADRLAGVLLHRHRRRAWPTSWGRWPIASAWRSPSASASRSSGPGQQQVRFIWANIGAFHVCLWTFTMTEAWAWGRKEEELVDRSASPWDKAVTPPEPRGQAAGVASRIAGRGNSCGSTPRGHRGGDSGRRRQAAQPGRMTYTISRKVQRRGRRRRRRFRTRSPVQDQGSCGANPRVEMGPIAR